MNITPPLMISIAISVLFTSCGQSDQASLGRNGIQDTQSKTIALALLKPLSASQFLKGKRTDGFLPAPVSQSLYAKSAGLPKDKHGMPTYRKDSTRHRVVRTTAYSHMEMEKGAPWKKNAEGTYLKYGKIRSAAADWSRYPVGTKIKIKGLPYTYIIDDYGSALVGTNTIDIYNPTIRSMNRWGTRRAEITVIQWGSLERAVNILRARRGHQHCRQMYYAAKARLNAGHIASN
ncbi:MAG: 3D domain-containing protein [Akkermansiaceae bacterium]